LSVTWTATALVVFPWLKSGRQANTPLVLFSVAFVGPFNKA